MSARRRLPFPELPERRRSRVHWGAIFAILGFGFAVIVVIRAVRQPGMSAMPAKVEQAKK